MLPAPQIDKRSAADVAQQLGQLLGFYAPGWNEEDPATGEPEGLSAALIAVAARFTDVTIQRLNQMPGKNFLAFLDLLGAALTPPQPARVPLTFSLAKGSISDGLVPAGTQVAAPPGPGEKDPIIYETEDELLVTAAQLTCAFVRDPEQDAYADYSGDLLANGSDGTALFRGTRKIDHVIYVGQANLLSSSGIANLSLTFTLQTTAGDALNLRWEIWDGAAWIDRTPADPAKDGTRGLQQSGTIQFGALPPTPPSAVAGVSSSWIRCSLLTPISPATDKRDGMARASQLPQIAGVGLRVHLQNSKLRVESAFANLYPIDLSKDFFPFGERPRFNDTLWLAVDEAFGNDAATVTLTITLTNAPGSQVQSPLPANPSPDLKLKWELWNGAWVEVGTSTPTGPVAAMVNGLPFADGTNAFTKEGDVVFTTPSGMSRFVVNGKQSFWLRVRIISGNYGQEGRYVVRAPVAGGVSNLFDFVLPNIQPPSISAITVKYDADEPASTQNAATADTLLSWNDSCWRVIKDAGTSAPTFAPFLPCADTAPTLYLGCTLPPGRSAFPNEALSIFFRAADLQYGQRAIPLSPDISRAAAEPGSIATHKFFITNSQTSTVSFTLSAEGSQWTPIASLLKGNNSSILSLPTTVTVPPGWTGEIDLQVTVPPGTPFGNTDSGFFQVVAPDGVLHSAQLITVAHAQAAQSQQLRLAWEYWNGQGWAPTAVSDTSTNFTATGVVEFLPPMDFAPHVEFGASAWWLRARHEEGTYDTGPWARRFLLNTVMAAQTSTVRNEVLGSGEGSATGTFSTTRTPVLAGQRLEVREPEAPTGDELDTLAEEEGPDAISIVRDPAGGPPAIWVRWHEVRDFHASDARSRHYTLDHLTGEIRFGDGLSGLIPPVGAGNLRMALYSTGGGLGGNKPAGSIIQLKTTLPYIDKVTNFYPATGGADAESVDSLTARAPTEIRHRGRAVTAEDYEDLAHLASPDVARALCVPNRDLVADPLEQSPPTLGCVSIIIVPGTKDPHPQPNMELVRRVHDALAAACPATATVLVVGPLYLRVDVQVEIGLASVEGSASLDGAVQDALAAFLHPLTGGFSAKGWDFGREPHKSDLYTVIRRVPGVDHIRSLTVQQLEDLPGTREAGRFLVYSGTHTIRLVFEPA